MAGVDEWGALRPGNRIAGYEIRRKLGQGGFGIAYEGFNPDLRLNAAIKEFFPRDFVGRSGTAVSVREKGREEFYQRFLNRFIDEARAVHRLNHPHIVKVRHFERANNTAYVVMDYIDGAPLKDWLFAHRGKLAEADLRAVFEPVMDALAYVHDHDMLHRDVSPANIMVDMGGKPWLIDFGAFKELWKDQPRRTTVQAANPAYAAPEQLDEMAGQGHGPFTDIFALSATMYEAIAGKKPSSAMSRTVSLISGRTDSLEPLGQSAAVVCNPAVVATVMRGLTLAPSARPQTIAEMRQAMGWVKGATTVAWRERVNTERLPPPIRHQGPPADAEEIIRTAIQFNRRQMQPPPVSPPPAGSLPRRRSRLMLGIGLSVMVVGATAAGGAWWITQPTAEELALREQQIATAVEQRQRQSRHDTSQFEWQSIMETEDEAAIERFIADHGDAPAVEKAKSRLAQVRREKSQRAESERQARLAAAQSEWDQIKTTADSAAIERFIAAHRDTPTAEEARLRLASLIEERRLRLQTVHVLTAEEEDAVKAKDHFRECAACPRMVVVPLGKSQIGSPPGELGRFDNEGPTFEVEFAKPFAVSKFEVTVGEYMACVRDKGCAPPRWLAEEEPNNINKNPNSTWKTLGAALTGENYPIIGIRQPDALQYTWWLSKKTNRLYRLLSSTEWEYAARANTTTRYSWGNDLGRNQANCKGCGSQWDDRQAAPVGQFPANAFGLHDMHGNVEEWVADCYEDKYKETPKDGAPLYLDSCEDGLIVRGGSWKHEPGDLRSASRVVRFSHEVKLFRGFRVARTLGPLKTPLCFKDGLPCQ